MFALHTHGVCEEAFVERVGDRVALHAKAACLGDNANNPFARVFDLGGNLAAFDGERILIDGYTVGDSGNDLEALVASGAILAQRVDLLVNLIRNNIVNCYRSNFVQFFLCFFARGGNALPWRRIHGDGRFARNRIRQGHWVDCEPEGVVRCIHAETHVKRIGKV